MPLPKTTDIGKLISELHKSKKKLSHKQVLAIAFNEARKNGANISKESLAMKKRAKK